MIRMITMHTNYAKERQSGCVRRSARVWLTIWRETSQFILFLLGERESPHPHNHTSSQLTLLPLPHRHPLYNMYGLSTSFTAMAELQHHADQTSLPSTTSNISHHLTSLLLVTRGGSQPMPQIEQTVDSIYIKSAVGYFNNLRVPAAVLMSIIMKVCPCCMIEWFVFLVDEWLLQNHLWVDTYGRWLTQQTYMNHLREVTKKLIFLCHS